MSSFTNTALVTGGTVNLGYHAALNIAKKHPETLVVITSRTDPNNAAATLNKLLDRSDQVIYLPLDLASLPHVRSFVTTFAAKKFSPITSLLLNAGIQLPGPLSLTSDTSIEKTFAVNHLGHALLFYLLTPYLAPNASIVLTSSGTHDPAQKSGLPDAIYDTAEELAHPVPGKSVEYKGRQRYATSKLCNIMWTYALHRRLVSNGTPDQKWTVNAFDPGLMPGTGLARDAGFIVQFLWMHVLPYMIPLLRLLVLKHTNSVQESGAELAALGLGESCKGRSGGEYFSGYETEKSSVLSYDEEKQEDLWAWTVEHVANDEAEKNAFEKVYPDA